MKSNKNFARWFRYCASVPAFASAVVSASAAPAAAKVSATDQGNSFKLKGAKDGNVVTRFPPEASGYLHIGHAKAALINQTLAHEKYGNGKLIMRFDDTNPEKEKDEYEKVILQDLELLGIKPDEFTHTSDHFDYIMSLAVKLIDEGKAYVDDTEAEQMKAERLAKKPSKNRDSPIARNKTLWNEMVAGSDSGVKCCLRIKLDYASDNGCLRDPTIYRCKPEEHVRTGNKFKVYPTYDFACPIVDSKEGVTHALRTTEYLDREVQFAMIAKACEIPLPGTDYFSRLALKNTCMSKRQLTWFVDNKKVDGWSDPRFPTVRGILRRGMTIEGLKKYIESKGMSRVNSTSTWDKIWAFNRQVIDPEAQRHTAVWNHPTEKLVTVGIAGLQTAKCIDRPLHPKNSAVGMKKVWLSPSVLIEAADADSLTVGEKVTFMDMGNVKVVAVERMCGVVTKVDVKFLEGDSDYHGTQKFTWVACCAEETPVKVTCIEYGDLITADSVTKEDGIEGLVRAAAADSKWAHSFVGASFMGVKAKLEAAGAKVELK
jgi:bifunctional glutamyl/prolyl-tRNA synthetase